MYLTEDLFKIILEFSHNFHDVFTLISGIANKTQCSIAIFSPPQSFETHGNLAYKKYVQYRDIKILYRRMI